MTTCTRRDIWLALNQAILDHIPAPRGIYLTEWDKPAVYIDLNSAEDAARWARRFNLSETSGDHVGFYMGWIVLVTWRGKPALTAMAVLTPDSDELPAVTQ